MLEFIGGVIMIGFGLALGQYLINWWDNSKR